VMLRMAQKLRPPKFEEGFAKVIVVRLKSKKGAEAAAEPPASEAGPAQDIGSEDVHSENTGEE